MARALIGGRVGPVKVPGGALDVCDLDVLLGGAVDGPALFVAVVAVAVAAVAAVADAAVVVAAAIAAAAGLVFAAALIARRASRLTRF